MTIITGMLFDLDLIFKKGKIKIIGLKSLSKNYIGSELDEL